MRDPSIAWLLEWLFCLPGQPVNLVRRAAALVLYAPTTKLNATSIPRTPFGVLRTTNLEAACQLP